MTRLLLPKKFIKILRIFLSSVAIFIVCLLFYIFIFLKPSNHRNWVEDQIIIPSIQIDNNMVRIDNIRDYRFAPKKITEKNYLNRTVAINKLEKVWFMVEPFAKYNFIAHTYFIFDFTDGPPVAVSIEARREKGEEFSAFLGTFNKFELMYVWGTESDATSRRVLYENNKVYMYPLRISDDGMKKLFVQLAMRTKDLETNPRFYNTLTSNCTNELAKSANQVRKNAIPFNLALFLPGYSVPELYKLGYLPNQFPVEQLPNKYFINDIVNKTYDQPDFSKELRSYLSGIK